MRAQLAVLAQTERDLERGEGIWRDTAVGRIVQHLHDVNDDRVRTQRQASQPGVGWRQRGSARVAADRLAEARHAAAAEFERLSTPIRDRLESQRRELVASIDSLQERAVERQEWLAQHPEAQRRVALLTREVRPADPWLASRSQPERSRTLAAEQRRTAAEVDLGPDLAM